MKTSVSSSVSAAIRRYFYIFASCVVLLYIIKISSISLLLSLFTMLGVSVANLLHLFALSLFAFIFFLHHPLYLVVISSALLPFSARVLFTTLFGILQLRLYQVRRTIFSNLDYII